VLKIPAAAKIVNFLVGLKLPGARYILEINFVMFIAGFSMFLADVAIVYFAQTPPPVGFGLNTFETALVYVPSGIAVLVASPLFGVLVTPPGSKEHARVRFVHRRRKLCVLCVGGQLDCWDHHRYNHTVFGRRRCLRCGDQPPLFVRASK